MSALMQIQDYARQYEDKTDDELLRLALEADQLTPEANLALQAALSTRGINQPERLSIFRQEERLHEEAVARDPGRFGTFFGIGREHYGKADYNRDPETGIERFKTTVFFVLFYFPLIPMRTYLVERDPESFKKMAVLQTLPIDWQQVLKVWVAAAAILFALVWAAELYSRLS